MSHDYVPASLEACSVERIKRTELSKYCEYELNSNGDARQHQSYE